MSGDKAPRPDGFTGKFFKKSWDTIKEDVMRVIELFGNLYTTNFHWLNSASIALLPKSRARRTFQIFSPLV
jgi:hypothetical protein